MISEYLNFPDYENIIGIDEAGRGPIAGPVVIASVILSKECTIQGLGDSKKLSAKQRQNLFKKITFHAIHYTYEVIQPHIIDEINILQATFQGMCTLLDNFYSTPYLALIDGPYLPQTKYDGDYTLILKSIVSGDATYNCIAAASIIAKVVRDEIMDNYHTQYPEYGFIHNKGYCTEKHKAAIEKYGTCPIHRKSFSPVKELFL